MKPMWVDFLYDLESAPDSEFVVKQFSKNINEDLEDIEDAIKALEIEKALKLLEEMRGYV